MHLKDRNGYSTDGGQAQNGSRLPLNPKVFVPPIPARVEQPDHFLGDLVSALDLIGLVEVARAARQRAIRFVVRTISRRRDDVLNFEDKIENRFWSPAILTAMATPLGHERIERVHGAN